MCLDEDWAVTTTLHRTAFGMKRITDGESVDFVLPHGEWIRLFRRHGLVVDDLIELQPAAGGDDDLSLVRVATSGPAVARGRDLDRPQALTTVCAPAATHWSPGAALGQAGSGIQLPWKP